MNDKSEWALMQKARLSDRIAVEMTIGPLGFVCEWEPNRPDILGIKLNKQEAQRYRKARTELVKRYAENINLKGNVLIMEV